MKFALKKTAKKSIIVSLHINLYCSWVFLFLIKTKIIDNNTPDKNNKKIINKNIDFFKVLAINADNNNIANKDKIICP